MFGCECWVHIADEKKNLEPKSHNCIFIGYDENYKAYRLFNPSIQSVIIIRYVQFHEVSPPPEYVEPHTTLNFPISPITPISITPFSSYVPIVDLSSSSSSSITPESNEAPEVTSFASHLPIWAQKILNLQVVRSVILLILVELDLTLLL